MRAYRELAGVEAVGIQAAMSARPLGDRSNAEKREAPGGATGAKKVRAAADPSVEAFLKAELESVVAELGAHGDEQVCVCLSLCVARMDSRVDE